MKGLLTGRSFAISKDSLALETSVFPWLSRPQDVRTKKPRKFYTYIYIYIYIKRERERDVLQEGKRKH
jgi:hypothetical protein